MQQKNMATAFKDIFGEMLLSDPIDPNATSLPSPNQLKRKIILKHKKLPKGASDNEWKFTLPNDESACCSFC
jgi:phosphatidylinositol phospholipase C gamma-1